MSKKRILITTHNPAKLERYRMLLAGQKKFKLVSLSDIGITRKVEENEPRALKNAIKKAREYTKLSDLPTLAVDEELFIDILPPEKQPGVNVRRIVGHEATDEELLNAVLKLLEGLPFKKRGCIWNFAIALAVPNGGVFISDILSSLQL